MADTTVELRAPLPDGASRATLTWLAKGAKAAPTTRGLAAAASLTSYSKSGIASTVRLSLDEADGYLADAESLRSGRTPAPRRTPAPPTPAPPTPRPAQPTRAGGNRSVCARCGARLSLVGPMHLLHVEDLDSFYRKAFDPALLSTSTVYRYECATCHAVEFFTTAG